MARISRFYGWKLSCVIGLGKFYIAEEDEWWIEKCMMGMLYVLSIFIRDLPGNACFQFYGRFNADIKLSENNKLRFSFIPKFQMLLLQSVHRISFVERGIFLIAIASLYAIMFLGKYKGQQPGVATKQLAGLANWFRASQDLDRGLLRATRCDLGT